MRDVVGAAQFQEDLGGRKRGSEQEYGRDVRQMTDMDLRHKLNRDQDDRRRGPLAQGQFHMRGEQVDLRRGGKESSQGGSSNEDLCYNCNKSGHHMSQCTNPPFGYSCKLSGHIAPKCPSAKINKGLKLCSMGMPGQLFYSLHTPEEDKREDKTIRALLTVTEGRGTKLRVTTELRYLIDSEWDWQVKRMSSSSFLFTLPSMAVLKLLKNMKEFKFTCYDMQAVVEETNLTPDFFDELHSVWVIAVGIPKTCKKTEAAVLELAYLVGDLEEVHAPSLDWQEVWVKVACKNPKEIKGTTDVYINKKGYKIS